ncbi:N-acetylmuramoyl-L-alanine amidase [Desnuesiella massiliensis]|uniref:N-acetylmuramoyl-L-alanine amidase n=1 Tax=Desnuesiella massiliensis TaxID=1650662 RepID=UPI0006E23016|nr:N-acetylmuramoyl-L-alanine amidase [Desnuesiella massiliensis]
MATVTKPYIKPRSSWNASAPTSSMTRMYSVNNLVIHHSEAVQHEGTGDAAARSVKSIQEWHQGSSNGWADIGYHYLISVDGQIFEGRDINYQGAHVENNNQNKIGICCLGNYMSKPISGLQHNSLVKLLAWLLQQYGGTIVGHRDVGSSNCPGDSLYAQKPQIIKDAFALLGIYES